MDTDDLVQTIQAELPGLFEVEDRTADFQGTGGVRFRGRLLVPVDEAYERLRPRLAPHRLAPLIRREGGQDVLLVLPQKLLERDERTGRPWVNVLFFLATVFTVLLVSTRNRTPVTFWPTSWSGWPFAVGLLGILLTHELGHYFASRYHGIPVTLPYFIPVPFPPLGTFGAVIVNKGTIKDRKTLLDVGASGPLAGLIVAIPRPA